MKTSSIFRDSPFFFVSECTVVPYNTVVVDEVLFCKLAASNICQRMYKSSFIFMMRTPAGHHFD